MATSACQTSTPPSTPQAMVYSQFAKADKYIGDHVIKIADQVCGMVLPWRGTPMEVTYTHKTTMGNTDGSFIAVVNINPRTGAGYIGKATVEVTTDYIVVTEVSCEPQ